MLVSDTLVVRLHRETLRRHKAGANRRSSVQPAEREPSFRSVRGNQPNKSKRKLPLPLDEFDHRAVAK